MKTQLKIRTEFSFRTAYGPIERVTDRLQSTGCKSAAITDRSSTFGHVQWAKHCKIKGIKPIFGVELAFTPDVTVKPKKQELYWLSLLARTQSGLQEIYHAVEEATGHFHYVPRLPIHRISAFSNDVIVLSGTSGLGSKYTLPSNVYVESHSATSKLLLAAGLHHGNTVAVSDNYMIVPTDRTAYEILIPKFMAYNRPAPMHILDEWEARSELDTLLDRDFQLADRLAEECNVTLQPATNIKAIGNNSLAAMCVIGATKRGINLNDTVYSERLYTELDLIKDKGYEDYFIVIADMVEYAKRHMVVGPARGSSCGSLVCYLLGITDIDPIPYGLIFERFIDVTRTDLPDIDIDFQDTKRDMVFEYLTTKYGQDRVARLGTVNRFKARSAIGETAKILNVPSYEAEQLKNCVVERSPGDERANLCIFDSFTFDDTGRELIRRHPAMMVASDLEAHARHSGKHAAGVLITNEPISNYVARDVRTNTVHIDKYDAETINLMKVDCLGLRTLTVIADCLEQVGWTAEQLLHYRLDDDAAYALLRNKLYRGIFQFEGDALQQLTRKVEVNRLSDLTALTALARPGTLVSGAAYDWCDRRMGRKERSTIHPMMDSITSETYGLIVYQEQMLRIVREIGQLSWIDCTKFRRGINKKEGMDYFDREFWSNFRSGANAQGIDNDTARSIWETVNGAGGYAFNKSHSVAYATVSYWCMVLKSKFPMEFALASLRNSDDSLGQKSYLREMDRAGLKFKPYDAKLSEADWSIQNGMLVGGLMNVKGIGPKMAERIVIARSVGYGLSEALQKKLADGETSFDDIFEVRKRFGWLLDDPKAHNIIDPICNIIDIEKMGSYVFIGKIVKMIPKSLNDAQYIATRPGGLKLRSNHQWLNLILEDDTGTINATIPRSQYATIGETLAKRYGLGYWFLWRGSINYADNRRVYITKCKVINDKPT